jgi:heat shock protein HslJ
LRKYREMTIVLVALVALLPACGTPHEAVDLDGNEWILTSLNGETPLHDTQITLAFEDGVTGGFGGCNAYGGPYTSDGDALSIDEIASTAQACLEPEGVMGQESAYLDTLWAVGSYRVADERLELLDEAGQVRLVYARQEVFEGDPGDLAGTAWRLVALDGSPLGEDMTYSIVFEDGRYSGLAGCRHFEGDYQAGDGEIGFLSTFMIEDECPNADAAYYVQEGRFTDSLTWARHWRIRDGQLEIHTAGGSMLVFEAVLRK